MAFGGVNMTPQPACLDQMKAAQVSYLRTYDPGSRGEYVSFVAKAISNDVQLKTRGKSTNI